MNLTGAHRLLLGVAMVSLMAGCRPPKGDERHDLEHLKQEIRTRFPFVRTISTADLAASLESLTGDQPLLLDVRAAEESAVSHLPGAELTSKLTDAIARIEAAEPGRTVVLYCSVGYLFLPGRQVPASPGLTTASAATSDHNAISGLSEFLRRWEINDLLFSVLYENVRPRREEMIGADPWYSVMPAAARNRFNAGLQSMAGSFGLDFSGPRLAFLFTQVLAGVILLTVAGGLAMRGWPDDHGEALVRRAFLCLAWLWFLNATQNPWYWTWAMPLVVFASRPWLLVSGFSLIYYLRFWFMAEFPEAILPGGLNGRRFFDEVVVWVEHLPALFLVLVYWVVQRRTTQNPAMWTRSPGASSPTV